MKPIEVKQGQTFNRWTVLNSEPVIKRYGKKHAKGKGRPVRSFLCSCQCGTIRFVRGDYLHSGQSKSCGCLLKEVARAKGLKQKTPTSYHNLIFAGAKANANSRKFDFNLSKEDHLFLVTQNCFYCGIKPTIPKTKQATRVGVPFAHHGIDRKDSSLGYKKENCVACCATCNFMKRTLSVEEFISKCNLISNHTKHLKELNLSTDKLQEKSNKSSANNSPSLEKQPSAKNEELKDDVNKWRSEGRGTLFF